MSHFNVSLIVWAKSQDSLHKPQFLKRKDNRSGSNRGPSAYQPSALPLGHIGSQETGVVGYTFYGVVPKGLLTFLGSLYKEGAKTTPGALVYRFERQTAGIFFFLLSKNTVPST